MSVTQKTKTSQPRQYHCEPTAQIYGGFMQNIKFGPIFGVQFNTKISFASAANILR